VFRLLRQCAGARRRQGSQKIVCPHSDPARRSAAPKPGASRGPTADMEGRHPTFRAGKRAKGMRAPGQSSCAQTICGPCSIWYRLPALCAVFPHRPDKIRLPL
jgi:hypothetical protein